VSAGRRPLTMRSPHIYRPRQARDRQATGEEIVAISRPAAEPVTVAEYLEFYDRRGYGFEVGLGERPAVLVIDFSIAFTRGTDKFPGGGYDSQVARTRELLDAARPGVPVLYTTIAYDPDMHDAGLWAVKIPWIDALRFGSREVEIDERLAPRPDEPVLVKKFPSAFFGTDLDRRLRARGVDTLIVAGCTTSACVRASVVDAMQHGYRTTIAADAVGDITQALHRVHLADLRSRYADARTVAELVPYLQHAQAAVA
jgi:maleamate amidohydrolase